MRSSHRRTLCRSIIRTQSLTSILRIRRRRQRSSLVSTRSNSKTKYRFSSSRRAANAGVRATLAVRISAALKVEMALRRRIEPQGWVWLARLMLRRLMQWRLKSAMNRQEAHLQIFTRRRSMLLSRNRSLVTVENALRASLWKKTVEMQSRLLLLLRGLRHLSSNRRSSTEAASVSLKLQWTTCQ